MKLFIDQRIVAKEHFTADAGDSLAAGDRPVRSHPQSRAQDGRWPRSDA